MHRHFYFWQAIKPVVIFIALALSVSACSTGRNFTGPQRSSNIDQDIRSLEAAFADADSIADFYDSSSGQLNADKRDKYITGRLAIIDLQYMKFIRNLTDTRATIDTAADVATLGVDLAITTVGGETVKSALGAASAGISGVRTSVVKNFFYEKTVPALIASMSAERQRAIVPIFDGLGKPINEYPFARAIVDLESYYFAGTFEGALLAIQQDAGKKSEDAETLLAAVRRDSSFVFADQDNITTAEQLAEAIRNLSDEDVAAAYQSALEIDNEEFAVETAQALFGLQDGAAEAVAARNALLAFLTNLSTPAGLTALEAIVAAFNEQPEEN